MRPMWQTSRSRIPKSDPIDSAFSRTFLNLHPCITWFKNVQSPKVRFSKRHFRYLFNWIDAPRNRIFLNSHFSNRVPWIADCSKEQSTNKQSVQEQSLIKASAKLHFSNRLFEILEDDISAFPKS